MLPAVFQYYKNTFNQADLPNKADLFQVCGVEQHDVLIFKAVLSDLLRSDDDLNGVGCYKLV